MPREDKVPHATKETQISEVLISTGATLPVCGWKAWPTPNQGMVPRPECGAEKKIPTRFNALQARNKWQAVRLIYV